MMDALAKMTAKQSASARRRLWWTRVWRWLLPRVVMAHAFGRVFVLSWAWEWQRDFAMAGCRPMHDLNRRWYAERAAAQRAEHDFLIAASQERVICVRWPRLAVLPDFRGAIRSDFRASIREELAAIEAFYATP